MLKLFSYKPSGDTLRDSIVDAALDLARQTYANEKAPDYKEKNKTLCESIGRYAVQDTVYARDFESKGLNAYKSPMVTSSSSVREHFNAIIAQVVTAIVPEVTNDVLSRFIAEVHQVGYGDTARFIIESNDLFVVNSKAEGVRKGVDQPMFNNEITVNAHAYTIDTAIDWYPFAAGVFDFGSFGVKIAKSFLAFIFLKVVKGMTEATTAFGNAYKINGVTPELFGDLVQKVKGANGGMNVICVGTPVALANLSLEGNYQTQIGEEMNKVGYLDQYLSTPIIAIDNPLIPGTTNTTAQLALDNDTMWIIPVAGDRPVKVVFEGDEVSVMFNPETTADKRYGISVEMRIGVSAICGSKYGTISL